MKTAARRMLWSNFQHVTQDEFVASDCDNFSCVLGFAVAQGCGTKFTAYTKCINAASNP
jgi:hypothetical protein